MRAGVLATAGRSGTLVVARQRAGSAGGSALGAGRTLGSSRDRFCPIRSAPTAVCAAGAAVGPAAAAGETGWGRGSFGTATSLPENLLGCAATAGVVAAPTAAP